MKNDLLSPLENQLIRSIKLDEHQRDIIQNRIDRKTVDLLELRKQKQEKKEKPKVFSPLRLIIDNPVRTHKWTDENAPYAS